MTDVPAATGGGTPDGQAPLRAPLKARLLYLAREYAILLVVVALFVTLSISSDVFLSRDNLLNIMEAAAPMGILACALTLMLIAGEFDLSVGAIAVIAGIFASKLQPELGTVACFVVAVILCTGLGLANGAVVTIGRVNSFVATLATALMITGLGLVITGGDLVTVLDESFGRLGFDVLFELKYSAWVFVVFALVCAFVLARTRFGRWIYAVGGNPEAARLSGVRTRLVKTMTFAIGGFAGGLAGIILVSQAGSGQAGDGISMVFAAFAAVVVGGTSIAGGSGAIWRTVLGVLFLKLIDNGFVLHAIDPVYAQIVQGSIILLAVALDALARRGMV